LGIDTFIYRQCTYSKRGIKIIGRVSGKKFKRTSIVAAKLDKDIITPLQYSGLMDSVLFEHWLEYCLIPLLFPKSTVVLDNAFFHNKKGLVKLRNMNTASSFFRHTVRNSTKLKSFGDGRKES